MPNEIVISGYKPFLIKKGTDAVKDSNAEWGMVVKSFPFKMLPKAKEPYKNSWVGINGDDEYNEVMRYEAYEIDVDFYAKAENNTTLITNIRSFFDYIKQGEFKIFDTYTGIGRQQVRYSEFNEDSYKAKSEAARLLFSIKFKVNDPITDITLSTS